MKVFLTGATGYIGSVVAEKLRAAGHEVLGLARSDEAAAKLEAAGVEPVHGALLDAQSVGRAARAADGAIHAAQSPGPDQAEADYAAVSAILDALEGSGKPFVYTSAATVYGDTGGSIATEDTPLRPPDWQVWRREVEEEVLAAAERGVRSVVIRPPLVYGRAGSLGLAVLLDAARREGVARYVGGGVNRWSTVHVEDLADLYVLALEGTPAGTVLNAAGEETVSAREVAEAIARNAGANEVQSWPIEEAGRVFGPFAETMTWDQQASGARAVKLLGWRPKGPSLLRDLESGSYARRG